MSNYEQLKADIAAVVRANGIEAITGDRLQQVLTHMVDVLGNEYALAGVATPTTNPPTPDGNTAYIAGTSGTYTYFLDSNYNPLVVPSNCLTALLMYDASAEAWTAYPFGTIAQGTIGTNELADGSVTTPKIADSAVTSAKIGANAVTSAKINNGAVSEQKLATAVQNKINDAVTLSTSQTITGGKEFTQPVALNAGANSDNDLDLEAADNVNIHALGGTMELSADDDMNISAHRLDINNPTGIDGDLSVIGDINATGSVDASGDIKATGKVYANINDELATKSYTDTQLATKQDTIADLATIRSGAALGATAYQKPSGGIPESDLSAAVQTSLGKADTALQDIPDGSVTTPKIADEAVTTPKIADEAVTLAKIASAAIDATPTESSDNLVTSGGVADVITEIKGGAFEHTYGSADLFGLYWNGTKFVAATSQFNGVCVPLKEGWTYDKYTTGAISSFIITPSLPTGGSTAGTTANFPFTAGATDKYLYVTVNLNYTFSVKIYESKDGLLTTEAEVDYIKSNFGEYKKTTYTSADYFGLYWNGTKFLGATASYNGILVPLKQGHHYVNANATGVTTRIILSSLPVSNSGSMLVRTLGTSDDKFTAASNYKYLYITVQTANFSSSSVTDEAEGVMMYSNDYNEHFGKGRLVGKKALIFGDSITRTCNINASGDLVFAKYNWPAYTMRDLLMDYANYAQDGAHWEDDSSLTQYQKVTEQITLAISKQSTADIVILNLGTNSWSVANDTYAEAVAVNSLAGLDKTKIHQAIRWSLWTLRLAYPSARFFMFMPMQRAGFFQKGSVFEAMKKIGELYGCYIFDQFSELGVTSVNEVSGGAGLYLSDGLHPNSSGIQLQARYISQKILSTYILP